ncbi:MAG: hypothetical protein WCG05_02880 [Alphaproteobacteria bacterium]
MEHLSIWKVLKESVAFTFSHKKVLGKLIVVPVLFAVLQVIGIFLPAPFNLCVISLGILGGFLAYSSWRTQWIQHCVTPSKEVKLFELGSIQRKFLGYTLLWALLAMLVFVACMLVSFLFVFIGSFTAEKFFPGATATFVRKFFVGATGAVAILPIFYWPLFLFIIRTLFMWPAISLGEATGFKLSWRQTKGFSARLFGLFIVLWGIDMLMVMSPFLWIPFVSKPLSEPLLSGSLTTLMTFTTLMAFSVEITGAILMFCLTKFYQHAVLSKKD